MSDSNILITASVGLYKDESNNFYLQVITAENEFNYTVPISKQTAYHMHTIDNLEITSITEVEMVDVEVTSYIIN